MPIADSLYSADPISLLAEVVVGSAFQVDAGRPAQLVVACTARISYRQLRPVWTFDERQAMVFVNIILKIY